MHDCLSPANRAFKLIFPEESPDSHRLMVRILILHILPVPEWDFNCSSLPIRGTDEPVNMNCPSSPLWSTVKRMASHILGAICHSSISRGTSPSRIRSGSMLAASMLLSFERGSSMYMMLLACCSAVVVLPHHFGPSISTAPIPLSLLDRIVSAILGLYSGFVISEK